MNHKITWDPPSSTSDFSGIRVFRVTAQLEEVPEKYFEITSGFSTVKVTITDHWETYNRLVIESGTNMGSDPSINHWDGTSPDIYFVHDTLSMLTMGDLASVQIASHNMYQTGIDAELIAGDGSEPVPVFSAYESLPPNLGYGPPAGGPPPAYYKQDFLDGHKVGTITDFLHTRCFVEDKNVPSGDHTYGVIGYNSGGYGECTQIGPYSV